MHDREPSYIEHALTDTLPISYADSERPPAPKHWQAALMLLGTVALTMALFFIPANFVAQLGSYGYVGVFVLTLLSSATIVLPSPALGVVALAGKLLDPWVVGVVGGVAASLGEITSYLVGLGGSEMAARSRLYGRVEQWVQRWGVLTIFVLAVIPSPIFDLAGIAAGTMRMPFRRYFVACLCGKVLRFILVAWIGYYASHAR